MFKLIGGAIVYGLALYGLVKAFERITSQLEPTKQCDSARI